MSLPILFFGHGNPMNAILRNPYTEAWRAIGEKLPRPKAILCISAHWYLPGAAVTINTAPRTIHDFGGFPQELYQAQYPAPGDPALARRVQALLHPLAVGLDEKWGLDHGTWSVLCHVYPNADVPVVQLSIDERQPASFHFDLGRRLAPLRDEGVLIIGSGNLVHNLHAYAWGSHKPKAFDWAISFEQKVREYLVGNKNQPMIDYETIGPDALLSVPTPDHYLPLLYVLGARAEKDKVQFPIEGVDGGSVSMLTVQIG
jgi:4,5-DOPA dioxygenase extradiol